MVSLICFSNVFLGPSHFYFIQSSSFDSQPFLHFTLNINYITLQTHFQLKIFSPFLQLLINLESYGRYFGIALTCLGGIFFITGITLTLTKRWKRSDSDDEDMLTN